jgi:His/Glu/Gln/Arg/opine family amino acid ABC transporter permease subunit
MQFAPWDMIENGKYIGVTRDQIDEVAKELGVKVEYNDLPWTGILPGLEAKRFDMCIAPVTATKERLKRYAFTMPIGASASMLMKRRGDTRLMKPEDMAGKTVGAQKGGIIINNLKTYMEQSKIAFQIREYQDNNQSYNDLASDRIDVAASSQPNLAYAVTKRPEIFELVTPPFGPPTFLCWVARLGDDSLISAVNTALAKMTGAWRQSRPSGSAPPWTCPRPCRNRPSERAAAAEREAMKLSIITDALPYLAQAALHTILYTLAGIALGMVLAVLVCIARISPAPGLRRTAAVYVSFCRGVPLLVQLMLIYYMLPLIGIYVPATVSAVVALGLAASGYLAEILRGALFAVPRGQAEAAEALGYGPTDIWLRILMPQALRISLPPVISEFILLMKGSSLISVIGVTELTRVGMNIASSSFHPLEAYLGAGMFYLAINLVLAGIGNLAERRMGRG